MIAIQYINLKQFLEHYVNCDVVTRSARLLYQKESECLNEKALNFLAFTKYHDVRSDHHLGVTVT